MGNFLPFLWCWSYEVQNAPRKERKSLSFHRLWCDVKTIQKDGARAVAGALTQWQCINIAHWLLSKCSANLVCICFCHLCSGMCKFSNDQWICFYISMIFYFWKESIKTVSNICLHLLQKRSQRSWLTMFVQTTSDIRTISGLRVTVFNLRCKPDAGFFSSYRCLQRLSLANFSHLLLSPLPLSFCYSCSLLI